MRADITRRAAIGEFFDRVRPRRGYSVSRGLRRAVSARLLSPWRSSAACEPSRKLARQRSTPPPPTPCPPPSCSLPRTDPASSNIELSSAIKPEAPPPLLSRPGTNENNPLMGIYTFFKPGPPTPPVASRLRARRPPRAWARELTPLRCSVRSPGFRGFLWSPGFVIPPVPGIRDSPRSPGFVTPPVPGIRDSPGPRDS